MGIVFHERTEAGHDIAVDRVRRKDLAGGVLEQLDRVGQGRVQGLRDARTPDEQAVIAVRELDRLGKTRPRSSSHRSSETCGLS